MQPWNGPGHKSIIFKYFAGRSAWIAPGRIGFMSTQRREIRPTPATGNLRGVRRSISNPAADNGSREFRNASRPAGRPGRYGYMLISLAASDLMRAGGIAAPPVDLALLHNGIMMTLGVPAAPSLQSDCCNTLPVGLVPEGTCSGRSPHRAGRHESGSLYLCPTGLPNQSALPFQRVSIRPCRRRRQP